jgi:hypothetical protein
MPTLLIEHPVPDFDLWKRAFDGDPVGRERSGVRRYQVQRPIDDPNYVMVDLDFDTVEQARALLEAMRVVWAGAGGQVSSDQRVQIMQTVETRAY